MNPFEDKKVADEWISAIENNQAGAARAEDIYPRILDWIDEFHPRVIVDIGCGQGDTSSRLPPTIKYIGVDPSKFLVHRAMQLHAKPNAEFLLGNASRMPIEDKSADAAFSIGVWFHFEKLDAAAKELNRVLKDGGHFYIITANPDLNNVWESFFARHGKYEKKGKRIEGAIGAGNWKISHNIFYLHDVGEVEASLLKNGFEIINVEKFGYKGENNDGGIWMGIRGRKL